MRSDNRKDDELRPVKIVTGFQKYAEGSALIDWGNTRVLCSATVEENVPLFRKESGGGWVTGEYNMLPRSTQTRKPRRQSGRETEIQRLIGRALRAAVDLKALGPRTITVDCDVLQADGGTRVAAITGGYVALALALDHLRAKAIITSNPLVEQIAAVSVGIIDGQAMLDLSYEEDSGAAVDMNLVMTASGHFVEIQGTGEHQTFDRKQLDALCDVGWSGIQTLCLVQAQALKLNYESAVSQ